MIYSFFDMLGDVGGFGEAVYILSLILVSGYASRMFFANLIQDIFKVRLDTNGQQIKELVKKVTMHREKKHSFIHRRTLSAAII